MASILTLHSNRRLNTGYLTALLSGFLTFTYLEPLFVPINSETAMVFLYILAFNGAMVGMSLGVLLPLVFPGACLGGMAALFLTSTSGLWNAFVFPISAGVLAVVLAISSARYVQISIALTVPKL